MRRHARCRGGVLCEESDLRVLPVELTHVLAIGTLPRHHNDPFDRLLVAQAQTEDLHLVTADEALSRYDPKICR